MSTTIPDDAQAWRRATEEVAAGADPGAAADALLAHMTTEERLSMLDGGTAFWAGLGDLAVGGYHRRPFPACAVPRLGVPGFAFSDGPRGAVIGPATAFPVAIARGATFDPALETAVGEAIGREIAAVGANLFGGVCINLLRHLAWGRAQETYSEDPYHLSTMGVAAVQGVQRHVMATVKHFACNSMEQARFTVDVQIELATLLEVYVPHFAAAVDAGVACVMSAYNSVNGEWCGQSRLLLDDVLRRRLGFEGFVISDWIFGLRDGVVSLDAGLDVEMPYRMVRHRPVAEALESGQLDAGLVDRACRRVLSTLLRFGVTEPTTSPTVLACDAHRRLARQVAAKSFVLLANDVDGAPLLPLPPDSSLGVFGHLATRVNLGDGGSSDVYAPGVVTLAAGLEAGFGAVVVDDGADLARAAAAAAEVDVAVVVVGSTRDDEGEYIGAITSGELNALMPGPDDPARAAAFAAYQASHDWPVPERYASTAIGSDVGGDRDTLELSPTDRALVDTVVGANQRTVVVVMGATAALVGAVAASAGAVLCVFYPGLEGGTALARVLRGDDEPAGRLPFALPGSGRDLVPFDAEATSVVYGPLHGQWHLDAHGTPAAYPFGFGLGWGPVELVAASLDGDVVTVSVVHQGPRPTDTVVFCHVRLGDHARPWRLAGFTRALVPAGGTAEVTVTLDRSVLARYDAGADALVVAPGPIEVEVGRWARDPTAVRLAG